MEEKNKLTPEMSTNSKTLVGGFDKMKKLTGVNDKKSFGKIAGIVLVGGVVGFLGCYAILANSGGTFEAKLGRAVEKINGGDGLEVAEVKDEKTGETVKVIKTPVGNSKDDVAVREIVEKMRDAAHKTIYSDDDMDTREFVRVYNEEPVMYKPEGLKAATELNLTYGFYYASDRDSHVSGSKEKMLNGDVRKAVVNELTRNGYKKYEYAFGYEGGYINETTGIVCNVSVDGVPYGVGCGSVNWYNVEDNWDLKNELAEAYKEKWGEYPYYMADPGEVKTGGFEKYQIINVSLGSGVAVFYRVNPESKWVFAHGGQAAPSCEDYNTDDLKKAFLGAFCWSEKTGTNSNVKL